MLEIRFLGQFDVRVNGSATKLASRQAQSLFAYLVLNRGREHRREKLAGLLWPAADSKRARDKLRYALWRLRKSIGDSYFQVDKLTLAFKSDTDYWLDTDLIEAKKPERLTTDELIKIVAVYQGDLLPGFYEDWVLLESERLQSAFESKIQLLLQRLAVEERWRDVVEWSEHWISTGKAPEPAFRALMVAHSQLGDNANAVGAYRRCEKTLSEELGVGPSDETHQLLVNLERGEKLAPSLPGIQAGFPPGSRIKSLELEPSSTEIRPFVARETALITLDEHLQQALAGQGRVVFVAGDAGRGKTALLAEFTRRAQGSHSELVAAYGSGEAHFGPGDPHLPFRDVLALLSGLIEGIGTRGVIGSDNAARLWSMLPQAAITLIEQGPDLIGAFVQGNGLLERASVYAPGGADWVVQLDKFLEPRRGQPVPLNIEHGKPQLDLFTQYTRVLQHLAQSHPLLILLDDLHWADPGTISLLSHLSRRIENDRILIVGSYRKDELTRSSEADGHPLAQTIPEIMRVYGDIEINLDDSDAAEGSRFIEAFLDTEPNKLGPEFRQALYEHTKGHPLFTIELLRQMQAQDELTQDGDGNWVLSTPFRSDALPARVEAVIAGRVNRLPEAALDILKIAAVEGDEFTAEVIADIQGVSRGEIIKLLSGDLDRHHRLVEAEGIQRIGERLRSVYRFRHHLFQKYLYDSLDEIERSYLHDKVGAALEALYNPGMQGMPQPTQTALRDDVVFHDELAVRLAYHFESAGSVDKAIFYLHLAGESAKLQSGNQEAVRHLSRALGLLETLPAGPKRDQQELMLQVAIGASLVALHGYVAPEVEQTYTRARDLSEIIGTTPYLPTALWGLWSYYLVRSDFSLAAEIAEQLAELPNPHSDPHLTILANWPHGITFCFLGEFEQSVKHLRTAVEAYFELSNPTLVSLYGQDPGATCLIYYAITLWCLGYPDQAIRKCIQAVELAEELGQTFTQAFVTSMAAVVFAIQRDNETALGYAKKADKIAGPGGLAYLAGIGRIVGGWAHTEAAVNADRVKKMKKVVDGMGRRGADLGRPFLLGLLAETMGAAGKFEDSLVVIDEAILFSNTRGERWNLSDLYRIKAHLLQLKGGDPQLAEDCYQTCLEIARGQNAKSFELRGQLGAGRAIAGMDQHKELSEDLRALYDWFSEGFDTPDLQEAIKILTRSESGK